MKSEIIGVLALIIITLFLQIIYPHNIYLNIIGIVELVGVLIFFMHEYITNILKSLFCR